MPIPRRLVALVLACAALAAPAPARAQDDEPAAEAPPVAKPKAKPAKPAAKKPAAKPSPRAAKPRTASASAAARKYPLETTEIAALSDALGSFLAEKSVQPLVLQEPSDDDQLTVAMQVLDESLDAQLKKSDRQPLTPPATSTAQGLASLLDEIATGAARPAASPAPAAPAGGEVVATTAAAELPSVDPTALASPSEEPPPAPTERVVRVVDTTPPSVAAPEPGATASTVRYTLAKVLVSRDGGPEQEVPIPSGGAVRPVPLAHRGGNPSVELKLVLKLPAALELGASVQVAAQAHVAAPGAAAELSLANEVVDTVRAEAGADAAAAAGVVGYSWIKTVGGIFSYQQTFAQGDGRSSGTVPPRSILFNWTDREPAIELPFAWSATAPAAVSLRGRVIYAPAARP